MYGLLGCEKGFVGPWLPCVSVEKVRCRGSDGEVMAEDGW
jgi:hypothetical protein